MKKIILVQEVAVDSRIVQKLNALFTVQFEFYLLQSFFPHLILVDCPDLVIFDISQQGTDWLWRLRQLSQLSDDWGIERPPVIVLTASILPEIENKVRMAKVDFYLPKVFDDDSLDTAFSLALD